MAQFITLTTPSYLDIRFNVDHIACYHPALLDDEPSTMGTQVWSTSDHPTRVRQTVEEIDRMINPTGTR